MDSKNIYIACKQYKQSVVWQQQADKTEWIYIGVGTDYNEQQVADMIDQLFGDIEVYYIHTRHDSEKVSSRLAAGIIGSLLEDHDATLSNKDFTMIMDFNKIGVARVGKRPLP